MDRMQHLCDLIETFKARLEKSSPKKRKAVIEKAVKAVKSWTESLTPSQAELKKELLTNSTAIRIREIYSTHKKSINLLSFAKDLGLTIKRPSVDHIIIGHYYPVDRLDELAAKLETLAQADPAVQARKKFQDWRARLKSLQSKDLIADEMDQLIDDHGLQAVRDFAAYLKTKSPTGRGMLGKRAKRENVVKAVAAHLWTEKMTTRAQEGVCDEN